MMSHPNEYTIAWICAITTEYVAAQAFLDEKHDPPTYLPPHSKNDYTLGRFWMHNVVISVLPVGEYGTTSAAQVAADLLNSFPNIRVGLMVGIGGGVPSEKHDIRLGDVVISIAHNGQGGVLQYDFGKTIQGQTFQPISFLNQPPTVLREAVNGLEAQYLRKGNQLNNRVEEILEKEPRLRRKYQRPDLASDRLYRSQVVHPVDDESTCTLSCGDNPSCLVPRSPRTVDNDNPAIHYGLIASANQLIKDAVIRDKLAAQKDILCFETEAAGLMNHFPCLVIRGICDYADSHKNKAWQGYAAMVATAYAKDLLYRIAPQRVPQEARIVNVNVLKDGDDYAKLTFRSHNSSVQADVNHGEFEPTRQQEFETQTEDDSKSTMSYQTDVESILSVGSQLSSQSSQGGLSLILISEFAHLLLSDNDLMLLYPAAISKVGLDKFQRNFTRFLKRYGKGLRGEALNERQRQAGHFVCLFARRTAAQMSKMLGQDSGELSLGQIPRSSVSNLAKVNAWLNLHEEHNPGLGIDALIDNSESSESEDDKQISLETLDEVKGFMVSTKAFSTLRQEFLDWLEASKRYDDKDMIQIDKAVLEVQDDSRILGPTFMRDFRRSQEIKSQPLNIHGDDLHSVKDAPVGYAETNMTMPSSVWLYFMSLCCPPEPGYKRISYTCGCGEPSYLDVKELSEGGIERLQRRLFNSIATIRTRSQPSSDSILLVPPPQAHLTLGSKATSISSNAAWHSNQNYIPSQISQPNDTEASSAVSQVQTSQFLLLCVNTRNSTALVHVEVGPFTSDQNLFQQILQEYRKVREGHEWKASMVCPFWVHNLLHIISKWLPKLPSLPIYFSWSRMICSALSETYLHKIRSGDFVRFQLIPVGVESCPRWFKTKAIPPEVEVREGRYRYKPFPMEDVEFADIPLRHLLKPGPHTDRFWINTFPKKTLCPLVRLPGHEGQRVIGWGVRINEGLNWAFVLLSILMVLLAIGAGVAIYATTTSDNSSAFGMGAYIVATFTVYLTYQYFAWKEDM